MQSKYRSMYDIRLNRQQKTDDKERSTTIKKKKKKDYNEGKWGK